MQQELFLRGTRGFSKVHLGLLGTGILQKVRMHKGQNLWVRGAKSGGYLTQIFEISAICRDAERNLLETLSSRGFGELKLLLIA